MTAELHHRPNARSQHQRAPPCPPPGSLMHAVIPSSPRFASSSSGHPRGHIADPNVIGTHAPRCRFSQFVHRQSCVRISFRTEVAGHGWVWRMNGDHYDHVQAIPGLEGDEDGAARQTMKEITRHKAMCMGQTLGLNRCSRHIINCLLLAPGRPRPFGNDVEWSFVSHRQNTAQRSDKLVG